MFTAQQIADTTGAPTANVAQEWPHLVAALAALGMDDRPVLIAAAATVATETGSFLPIPEWGGGSQYEGRADLGNTQPGDGNRYMGRGLIQLTGRANYRSYGQQLGVDLEGNPDLALDEGVSARVFAQYFRNTGCDAKARAGNWQGVRIAVNGGLNGWSTFITVVGNLLDTPDSAPAPPPTPPVTTLGVNASLKPKPDHTSVAVADLAAGCVVKFTAPAPGDVDGLTPHWVYCTILSGQTQKHKDAKGLKGWLLRADLRTVGG